MSKTRNGASSMRCAIYTRKSTEEGLEQEFNSLDAQREAALAYIASQRHDGWLASSVRYDDGGYTGANMERPALKRLLADVAAGRIDVVLVHKVDRLSRSLLDFARLMETFDKHQVAFVAVTQQFNSATSMGRLVLNILLSFAQFERELIAERTRDKIAAARRKGKWAGGHPVLGYDVDPRTFKLLVSCAEAERVRAIFQLYLQEKSLAAVVAILYRRGWRTKQWTTRKGQSRGGAPFTKSTLHKLLSNVVYRGQIRYKKEVHPGEHAAIIDPDLWQRVQALLEQNGPEAGRRSSSSAVLAGLLRCRPCGCAMTPAFCIKNRCKRYRYYTCVNAQKRGHRHCPSRSVPAPEIERFVLEEIKKLTEDSASDTGNVVGPLLPRWDSLTPQDQGILIRALTQGVDYDGGNGSIAITFHEVADPALNDKLARLLNEDSTCPLK